MRARNGACLALLVLTMGAAGCGDEEDGQPAAAAGDVERYCELTAQLDRAGEEAFKGLSEESAESDLRAAIRRLLDDNRDAIDEIQQVAPPEIREDVATFVEGQEQAAEVGEKAFTQEVQDAEKRITAFEKRECGDAAAGGG